MRPTDEASATPSSRMMARGMRSSSAPRGTRLVVRMPRSPSPSTYSSTASQLAPEAETHSLRSLHSVRRSANVLCADADSGAGAGSGATAPKPFPDTAARPAAFLLADPGFLASSLTAVRGAETSGACTQKGRPCGTAAIARSADAHAAMGCHSYSLTPLRHS
eukprot:scaffold7835_cov122-Isochrysis_galbana.AAC.1